VATKFKLTRPELKRFRDVLSRYQRYLPMLKLKQQQLQTMLREVARHCREAAASVREATETFQRYEAVLADVAGLSVRALAEPTETRTSQTNVAGVNIPVFEEAIFPKAVYSLFGTPVWVDQALADLRERNSRQAKLDVLTEQHTLLGRELTRIVQRVNLFEKVKIPEAREAIRVIRIKLGDEMTAAVGRAKIAKSKLADVMESEPGEAVTVGLEDMAENGGPSS